LDSLEACLKAEFIHLKSEICSASLSCFAKSSDISNHLDTLKNCFISSEFFHIICANSSSGITSIICVNFLLTHNDFNVDSGNLLHNFCHCINALPTSSSKLHADSLNIFMDFSYEAFIALFIFGDLAFSAKLALRSCISFLVLTTSNHSGISLAFLIHAIFSSFLTPA